MTKLETINAEDLQNRTYEPTHFLVDELIPDGLHILAGAPKIGKSWLALWLCLCVSQGQSLWGFATAQGEVLYLSLEDSFQRIQTRLFDLTEDAPPTLHFAIMANTLKHGLEQQIEQFLSEHPDTKLVVIDSTPLQPPARCAAVPPHSLPAHIVSARHRAGLQPAVTMLQTRPWSSVRF